MTGTPKSGEYLGLWSQIYCLDFGKALGQNITAFKKEYYYRYGPEHYHIKIKSKEAEADIRKRLRPLCYRIPDSEVRANLPEVVHRYHYLELPPGARKQYKDLEEDFFLEIEDEEITVNNIAIRSSKLQQICQGAIYTDEKNVKKIHNEKIDYLDSLLSGLGDSNALVVYTFRHDLERLLAFRNAPVLKSSMAEKKFNILKDEWNSGKHPVIYGHPKSIGHGLNIQGGGHHLIFFGLHWSLDLYQQVIGRLARTGQKASQVFVHHLVMNDTVETDLMLPRLKQKEESQTSFLQYFENYKRLHS
jgi:SNF2 family DNA or RNA helicase